MDIIEEPATTEDVIVTHKPVTTHKVVRHVVTTEHPQKAYEKKKTIFRAYQLIWYILGIIEVLLAFRFVLKAIGASQYSGFVLLINTLSAPFAVPFQGIVSSYVSGNSVIEWSTVIAAFVWLVIAYGLVYLFQLIKPVDPIEVEDSVDNP